MVSTVDGRFLGGWAGRRANSESWERGKAGEDSEPVHPPSEALAA